MADRVLILGASARAAAASARRAGLDPFAIDLFADADTKQLCDCLRCPPDRYPEGLFELAKQAPPMPWMYTGGLENYPELIGELARERELWGNGTEDVRRVRDPFFLVTWASQHGIWYPDTTTELDFPCDPGRWLRKPFASGGGLRIQVVDRPTPYKEGWYYQRLVDGIPMSAVIASRDRKEAILGITRQLTGEPWLHARRFAYCGNLTTTTFDDEVRGGAFSVAYAFAVRGKLRGVWGFDFINRDGVLVLIEVNPRYPASAEVSEFATGRPVLAAGLEDTAHLVNKFVGKAIYYAPHRLNFPASGPWDDSVRHAADVWRRPDFADVPHPGEVIEAGHPVLTILTEADNESECLSRLQSRAAELDRLFGFPTPEGESCRP